VAKGASLFRLAELRFEMGDFQARSGCSQTYPSSTSQTQTVRIEPAVAISTLEAATRRARSYMFAKM
jgi:hypothetical protein